MQAIILAAGKGERLFPITKLLPKPLIDINGIPLISHLINALPNSVNEIIIVIQYHGQLIIDYVTKLHGDKNIKWIWQNESSHGTMAAIISAKNNINGDFLAICSDNLYSKSSLEALSIKSNTYLALKVDTETKKSIYPTSKLSLFNSEPNLYILDAGAWHLEFDFVHFDPISVKNTSEIGLPHTLKGYAELKKIKIEPVYADWWYPVGTFEEIEILRSKLRYRI